MATSEVNKTGRAVTDDKVVVGQLHSATGTMAISETGSIQAERLAIEQINATGGILGRKIEIIQEDGTSDWRQPLDGRPRLLPWPCRRPSSTRASCQSEPRPCRSTNTSAPPAAPSRAGNPCPPARRPPPAPAAATRPPGPLADRRPGRWRPPQGAARTDRAPAPRRRPTGAPPREPAPARPGPPLDARSLREGAPLRVRQTEVWRGHGGHSSGVIGTWTGGEGRVIDWAEVPSYRSVRLRSFASQLQCAAFVRFRGDGTFVGF